MSASLLSLLQSGASSSPNISKYVAAALSFDPQSCEAPLSNLCSALRECREVSSLKQLVAALATHVHEIVRRKHVPLVVCLLQSAWPHYQETCKCVVDIIRTVVTSDNQFCAPVLNVLILSLIHI